MTVKRRHSPGAPTLGLGAWVLVWACGGPSGQPPETCVPGEAGCSCYPNATCDPGLACRTDRCVELASAGAGGETDRTGEGGDAASGTSAGGALAGGTSAGGGRPGEGGTSGETSGGGGAPPAGASSGGEGPGASSAMGGDDSQGGSQQESAGDGGAAQAGWSGGGAPEGGAGTGGGAPEGGAGTGGGAPEGGAATGGEGLQGPGGQGGAPDACATEPTGEVLLDEDFDADVFADDLGWTRSDESVAVADGIVAIASDGDYDDYADYLLSSPALPLVIEVRFRTVGAAGYYLLPALETYGQGIRNGSISYSPGTGWILNAYLDTHANAPEHGVWMTLRAHMRADGGKLCAQTDSQSEFVEVASNTWSIPDIENIHLRQTYDSQCEIDRVSARRP